MLQIRQVIANFDFMILSSRLVVCANIGDGTQDLCAAEGNPSA